MTTVAQTTDRPPLGEPVTATESLLNAKHTELLRDKAKLAELHGILTNKAKQEQEARSFLTYMEGVREFFDELELIVSANQDLLEAASHRTGWKPPLEGPLPIGDHIGHETLNTLGVPALRMPDLVQTMVGQYVRVWHASTGPDGMAGFLDRTVDGFAVLEDRPQGDTLAEFQISEIIRIEQWVAGGPTGTITSGLMGPPDARQELPADEMRAAVEAEKDVSRTSGQPSAEKQNGRGRR